MLQDIKQEDLHNFLEINIHITSVSVEQNDIRHVFTLVSDGRDARVINALELKLSEVRQSPDAAISTMLRGVGMCV